MDDVRRLPVGEDNQIAVTLDALAREGARRMIAAALKAEADDYVERFADERGEDGKRLVVRNGRARERRVTVGSGTVAVQAPRVNDSALTSGPASVRSSARGSCRPTRGARRRSTTCCRCSTCAGSPRATSGRRWSSCSGRTPPGGRRRRSAGCARTGRPSTRVPGPVGCGFTCTRTCSSTALMSRCGSAKTTGSA